MDCKKILLVFLFIWNEPEQSAGVRIHSFAGPYLLVVRRVINATDEFKTLGGFSATARTTYFKRGQGQYIWGKSITTMEFDDSYPYEIRMANWANNQWKRNAFIMKFKKGCSDCLNHAPAVMALIFGEDGKKCPVMPGERTIENQTLRLTYPHIPVFPYNRWLFDMVIFTKSYDGIVGAMQVEIETIPKL